MSEIWMDVDAALSEVPVNKVALIDDTDFKTREESVVYNQAGMDLVWNFVTTAGAYTQTAVTPTTAGVHDWTNQGNGMYSIEIPASAGTINNNTEGFGWFTGFATGILPWTGPIIGFRAAALNNALVDGGDNLDVNMTQAGGQTVTAAAAVTIHTDVGVNSTAQAALEDQYDGTGITGDTFPSTQSQLSGLANVGSAVHRPANSYTLTTGTQTGGTFASTEELDGVYHIHTDSAGTMELYYEFLIGAGIPSSAQITGYLTGVNDDLDIYGYDWVSASWKQIGNLQGTALASDQVNSYDMFVNMVGSGADFGKVRVRFYKASGLTTATLAIDQVFVSFSQSASGYENGRIWINTAASNTNTVVGVDGIATNAVSTIGAAKTISGLNSLTDFHLINGSSITLAASSDDESYFGDNWALALGGQSCSDIQVEGAQVSGIGTAASGEMHFDGCDIGTVSGQSIHGDFCGFSGTVTHTLAGDYNYHNCYSKVAGAGAPTFTKTPGQAITLQFRNWAGGIILSGLEAGDTVTVGGTLGTVTLNGADAAVEIRGTYKNLVNNLTGSPTVNTDGAILAADVAAILDDTGTSGVLLAATATSAQLVDDIMDENISKANHDVPNSLAKLVRQGGDLVQIDGQVSDVSPSTTNFDTNLTQVDTFFDDAVLIFSNGAANAGKGLPVSAYLNANGNMTFDAPDSWPVTPVNGDDFVVFANHVHPVSQIQSGLATEAKQDAAALINTEARLAELDAGNLPADVAAVKADTAAVLLDTNELQTDWVDGGRLDLILDAINSTVSTTGVVLTAGERNSIADAMLDRDMSTGADSGSPTVRTVRQALRSNRNKVTISGGTMTVTKEDDTTASWTAAITTTAGNPISEIDPA